MQNCMIEINNQGSKVAITCHDKGMHQNSSLWKFCCNFVSNEFSLKNCCCCFNYASDVLMILYYEQLLLPPFYRSLKLGATSGNAIRE